MIRFFDILFSFLGILFLSPVFLFLYIAIRLESKGGGFYKQLRVGRGEADFYVYKFRSMRIGEKGKQEIRIECPERKIKYQKNESSPINSHFKVCIFYSFDYKVQLFFIQLWINGQGDFTFKILISLWIVLYIISQ